MISMTALVTLSDHWVVASRGGFANYQIMRQITFDTLVWFYFESETVSWEIIGGKFLANFCQEHKIT